MNEGRDRAGCLQLTEDSGLDLRWVGEEKCSAWMNFDVVEGIELTAEKVI